MPEKVLNESTKLDIANSELIQQLFSPTYTADIMVNIAQNHPQLEIIGNDHIIQAIPASGDLIYFHIPDGDATNQLRGADFSIKFRRDGTIIYSESISNFRTKYDPKSGTVARYDRSRPGIPDQILPRHSKNLFLTEVIKAQSLATTLVYSETQNEVA